MTSLLKSDPSKLFSNMQIFLLRPDVQIEQPKVPIYIARFPETQLEIPSLQSRISDFKELAFWQDFKGGALNRLLTDLVSVDFPVLLNGFSIQILGGLEWQKRDKMRQRVKCKSINSL